MSDTAITGRCLCGQVGYVAPATPKWTALCHCESCRRAASAAVVAWMGFDEADVEWHGVRRFYRSSGVAQRSFCPECGTQMSFQSTRWPGEIHLYGVSRDDPENFRADLHCHYDERLPWVAADDVLPKYGGSADEVGAA